MKRVALLVFLFAVLFALVFALFSPAPPPAPKPPKKRPIPLSEPTRRHVPTEKTTFEADPKGPLSLSGQVLTPDGLPAPDAVVSLDSNPPRSITTDAQGWFFLEGLLGRTYRISARKQNASVGPLPVSLDSLTDPISLTLQEGAPLDITVLSEDDRRPVSGVKVVLEEATSQEATTNANGVAHFEGLRLGYGLVYLDSPLYSREITYLSLRVIPGQTQRETLYAQRGARVSGLVLGPDQKPLQGAKVSALPLTEEYFDASLSLLGNSALSDDTGAFVLSAIPDGAYRLFASHPSYRPVSSQAFTIQGNAPSPGHTITLLPGGVLSGRVVTTEGAPVPFASITLRYGDHPIESAEHWEMGGSTRETYCDQEGAFSLEGLAPGDLLLQAKSEALSPADLRLRLKEGERRGDLLLVLDPGEEIAGVVVDERGAPLPDIEVFAERTQEAPSPDLLSRYSRPAQATKTNAQGEFLLRGLPPGDYELSTYTVGDLAWDYKAPPPVYPTGTQNARLVLTRQPTATVKGKVLFADGSIPDSFEVSLGGRSLRVSQKAAFLLEKVPLRRDSLRLEGDSFLSVRKELTLTEGQELDLGVITVTRGRKVTGVVLDARGRPLAGATVTAYGEYNFEKNPSPTDPSLFTTLSREGESQSDGRFVIEGVHPGFDLTIRAELEGKGRSQAEKIPLGEGEAQVTLTMQQGATLTGTVTRAQQPIRVYLFVEPANEDEDLSSAFVSSGVDGVYRFENLVKGKYLVKVRREMDTTEGTSALTRTLEIKDDATITLDLELPVYPMLWVKVPSVKSSLEEHWSFLMLRGHHSITTQEDLDQFIDTTYEQGGEEAMAAAFFSARDSYATPEVEGRFYDVLPGPYTVCGTFTRYPVPKDQSEQPDPLSCQKIEVRQTPDPQEATLSAP